MTTLARKNVVVTDAFGALGAVTAQAAARFGARVALLDRTPHAPPGLIKACDSGASKSGVHRLTESLAEELKDTGITVNAVLPSIIDTPANRADMPQADFSKWVTPQALADVILFLASDVSQAITGALLPVTGRV